jgi:hypothetical protein
LIFIYTDHRVYILLSMIYNLNTEYHKKVRAGKEKNRFVIIQYNNKKYIVMTLVNRYYCVTNYSQLNKIINIDDGWIKRSKYPSMSGGSVYMHNYIHDYKPNGRGQLFSYDHLNRIYMDNRFENLEWKSQSDQNKNQSKPERNGSNYHMLSDNMREYMLGYPLPKYIYYNYDKSKGHKIVVDRKFPLHTKDKKFSSRNENNIPNMIESAEEYIEDTVALNGGMPEGYNQDYELSEEAQILADEYNDIVDMAKLYLS